MSFLQDKKFLVHRGLEITVLTTLTYYFYHKNKSLTDKIIELEKEVSNSLQVQDSIIKELKMIQKTQQKHEKMLSVSFIQMTMPKAKESVKDSVKIEIIEENKEEKKVEVEEVEEVEEEVEEEDLDKELENELSELNKAI